MPVVKKGFLFQYFDKIACGVVALGLLVSMVYAARRAGALARTAPVGPVEENIRKIEAAAGRTPDPVPKADHLPKIAARFESISPARTLPGNTFYPPLAEQDGFLAVGTDKEFVIEFLAPLKKGSIEVVSGAEIVALVEHPVGENYKLVRLKSGGEDGLATVVGSTGAGRHEYVVEVDGQVGKTAYPPTKVSAVSAQGVVIVRLQPNQQNEQEEVDVLHYEVWRRDWVDPLGSYRKAGQVAATATRAAGPRTGRPTFGPMGPTAYGAGTGAATAAAIEWQDGGVKPGEEYSYKARTVGANTYPAAGEFVGPARVEVSPDVAFRFSRSTSEKVGCDVVRAFAGAVRQHTFWVGIGEEIGGIVKDRDTGQVLNFLTGAVVVDFHRAVILPRVGVTDRMVFADSEGNLHVRLRREAESDLWQLAEQAERGVRPTGMVPGAPREPATSRRRGRASGGRGSAR